MVFCHECGLALPAGSKFCHECGTVVPQSAPAPAPKALAALRTAPRTPGHTSPAKARRARSPAKPKPLHPRAREWTDGNGNLQLYGFRELHSGPHKRTPHNLVDEPFNPKVGSGAVTGKPKADEKSNFCSPGNPMYVPKYAQQNTGHAVRNAIVDQYASGVRGRNSQPLPNTGLLFQ